MENVAEEGFKLFFNPKEVIEDAKNTKDKVVAIAKSVPSKLDEEKTSKLAKETETTLGATAIESVKAAEQAGEEAKVVSGIDRAKDTLERLEKLKKWEKSDVVELEITKTGETGKIGESGLNSSQS